MDQLPLRQPNKVMRIGERAVDRATGRLYRGDGATAGGILITDAAGTPTTVATPTFSPEGHVGFVGALQITLSSSTTGASIRYLRNGGTPTEDAGILYDGPFWITGTERIEAIAFKPGLISSGVADQTFVALGIPGSGGGGEIISMAETFARAGNAIDPITGALVAENTKSTRTLREPNESSSVRLVDGTNYTLAGVTSTGALLGRSIIGASNIYRSTDYGATWTPVASTGTNLLELRVFELAGPTKNILIAWYRIASERGMMVSVDDGVTWSTGNALTADEITAFQAAQPWFAGNVLVENKTGRALGDCKLIFAPYGNRVEQVNETGCRHAANRVFRSTITLSQLESGSTTFGWVKVAQMNMGQFWGTPGLGRSTGHVLITDGVVGSAAAGSLTETGKFTSLSLTNKPFVEILTGAGAGQMRHIASKTNDTLTLASNWATIPSASDTYRVVQCPPTTGTGLHFHCAAYEPTRDVLFVGAGDNSTSQCVLAISGFSELSGVSLTGIVPEQPVNWSAFSQCSAKHQPTAMYIDGDRVVMCADDWNPGFDASMHADSPYAIQYHNWNFGTPESNRNYAKGWDGKRLAAGLFIKHVDSTEVPGVFVGNCGALDGMVRVVSSPGGSTGYGIASAGDWYAVDSSSTRAVLARITGLESFSGTFLGRAQTSLITNADFAATTGSPPTQAPTSFTVTGGTTNRSVSNAVSPFAGLNYFRFENVSGSTQAPSFYQASIACVEGDLMRAIAAYRFNNNTASHGQLMIGFYDAGGVIIGSATNGNTSPTILDGQWLLVQHEAVAPANTATMRLTMRSQALVNNETMDIALPVLVKNPTGPILPSVGVRSAERLRYTTAALNTTGHTGLRLVWRMSPWRESYTSAARDEDILSIESHNGYRYRVTYHDNGSGTRNFRLSTYDSGGAVIAATSIGYINHSLFEVLKCDLRWQSNTLHLTVSTPGDTVTGSQSWAQVVRPTTIAYGENLWADSGQETANRFVGWYAHDRLATLA